MIGVCSPSRIRVYPCLSVVFFFLILSSAALASDWPEFLGPDRNGISSETGLVDKFPTNGLPLLWEKEIGTGYSAPSVRGERLVLHHRVGTNEVVECYDANSGKSLWQYSYLSNFQDPYGYNNGPRATPLLTEKFVYTFGAEGMLSCLDLQTGKPIWQHETAKKWSIPEAFFGVGSSPVLEGNLLLVMIGGQPNSGMAAFDAKTGKVVWENVGQTNWHGRPKTGWPGEPIFQWREEEKQASYSTPVIATVNGKRTAFCLMRQGLVSLDPATGKIYDSFWFRARVEESVNAANPIVLSNEVFISSAYYKSGSVWLKVRPDDQKFEQVRRDLVLEIHWTTPILHAGYLYAFSGRNEPDARFRCVEFSSGKLMWERDERWQAYSSKTPDSYGRGSAILADGKLIVLGEGGLLGLFEASPKEAKGISRWQVPQLHYPCWAAPVLANKKLYLRSENRLVCYEAAKQTNR